MNSSLRRLIRENGLSITLALIFLLLIVGQIFAGWSHTNAENDEHATPAVSLAAYLTSGAFGEAVFENWESEFLQMALYVVLTAFLFQRGSAESKNPDATSGHSPKPKTWRGRLYRHSLSLALFSLFILSFLGHAFFGRAAFNEEARQHGRASVSVFDYVISSQFWFESLQNWQSEFLAIFTLVVLSIWLREAGSPESKPVDAPHHQTGK